MDFNETLNQYKERISTESEKLEKLNNLDNLEYFKDPEIEGMPWWNNWRDQLESLEKESNRKTNEYNRAKNNEKLSEEEKAEKYKKYKDALDLFTDFKRKINDEVEAYKRKYREEIEETLDELKDQITKEIEEIDNRIKTLTTRLNKTLEEIKRFREKYNKDDKDKFENFNKITQSLNKLKDEKQSLENLLQDINNALLGKPIIDEDILGEPNPGEPNPGEPNPGEPDPGEPNPGEPNPGEPNPGEPNPGEPNPGEPNPGEPNPGEPNPGEPGPIIDIGKPDGKKRRGVKFVKKAKEFFKKHKKAILIVGGLALLAVGMHALIPSLMYLNSSLWGVAINSGLSATSAIPSALHGVNTVLGTVVGATYNAGSGLWTLANGTLLNSGAYVNGLLASLGKVGLSSIKATIPLAATAGGATALGFGVKDAVSKAVNKIRNRKKKIKDPDGLGFIEKMKSAVAKVKGKYNDRKAAKASKIEEEVEPIEETIPIEEVPPVEPTEYDPTSTVYNPRNINLIPKDVDNFYRNAIAEGIYQSTSIPTINELPAERLIELAKNHPRFAELSKTNEESEEIIPDDQLSIDEIINNIQPQMIFDEEEPIEEKGRVMK